MLITWRPIAKQPQVGEQLGKLTALIDRSQLARLDWRLRKAVNFKLSELQAAVERREHDGFEAAKGVIEQGRDRELTNQASAIVDEMVADEELQLSRQAAASSLGRTIQHDLLLLSRGLQSAAGGDAYNMVRLDAIKRSEAAALIESHEQRLRRVVESNVIGILFLDAGGTAVEANDAFLQLVGYDRRDLQAGKVSRATISASNSAP